MAKHRSFTLEKFIKATDGALLKQYFEQWEITVPDNLVFDGGDDLGKF